MPGRDTTVRPGGEPRTALRLFNAALLLACALAFSGAAGASDGATIVDSGSTNTLGYKIDVWSDGSAKLQVQNRIGVANGSPKTFTVPPEQTARFFADLKAARQAQVAGAPCMKSASFGTSTHVAYHGWESPDLDCPPDNPQVSALVADLTAIRHAAGLDTMRLLPGGPPHLAPSPSPT